MVAKSFQNMKQLGEPFCEKGKMYVKVQNEKSGAVRKVRWYTEAEYAKMYGEKVETPVKVFNTQKQVLGFENGYVTIFKGDTYANLEWFQKSIARYCKWWGWYIISTAEIPSDLPCGIEPIRLNWELVGEESGALKSDNLIKPIIDALLYDKTNSKYVGKVGERLDLTLTVVAVHRSTSRYGETSIHYMEDSSGNQFLWNTTSKTLEIDNKYHIRGTVKDHKIIRNVETTVLTRCALAK